MAERFHLPQLTRYTNDLASAITGAEQNTKVQWCDTFAQLRAFNAFPGMVVGVTGNAALNDGGQGFFQFVRGSHADDNANFLAIGPQYEPQGYWERIGLGFGGPGGGGSALLRSVQFVINGAGSPIPTGIAGDLDFPFPAQLTACRLLGDESATVEIDIWNAPFANYPPTVDNTIIPDGFAILTATDHQQQDLTGATGGQGAWTTALVAGTLRFNVQSNNNAETITIALVINTAPGPFVPNSPSNVLVEPSSFTLDLTQAGALILTGNANVTVPPNSSVAFPVDTRIDFVASNITPCAFIAGAGVTINSAGGSLSIAQQWGAASLIQTAANVWSLVGDLQ